MDISLLSGPPETARGDVIVLGAFPDGPLPGAAAALDRSVQGKISALVERGDLEEKAGSTLLVGLPGSPAERVLLVSLGARAEFGDRAYRSALVGAAKALAKGPAQDAVVALADIDLPGRSLAWRVRQVSLALADGAYRFDVPRATKSKPDRERGAREVGLLVAGPVDAALELEVRRGVAVAEGMALARDLGNLPGNVCTPSYLAGRAQTLGQECGVGVEVLGPDDMERLGMHSALSVGRGSDQPTRFIVLNYRGAGPTDRPVVLVGKGVTFDTGGISLKPADDLDMMKYDMSGAGSVLGVVKTVARLGLPINLVAVVVAAENMPGSRATRPGDVVRSMSGQTIEILNTDAEGRLLLCDALTYVARFQPACVIDVATLTGACVVALGAVASGLFSSDEELAAQLLRSGADSGDRVWRLPVWEDYQDLLKSNFADMANIGGRPAGAVTAACFLARFAKAYRWAHLDVAGTASVAGEAKGSTGRPVPLLAEFLIARSEGQPG